MNKKITKRILQITGAILIVLGTVYFCNKYFKSKPIIINPNKNSTEQVAGIKTNPIPEGFWLIIDKISVRAPVIADVDPSDENVYQKALENGAVHSKGNVHPGEKGNCFIFGHSSYYENKPGNYKTIFSCLPDLTSGDKITIYYNEKEYNYVVSYTKIVDPSDVNVIKNTLEERLTLMTCWPLGTDKQRFVVVAKRE